MKVKCIKNINSLQAFEIGKVYEVRQNGDYTNLFDVLVDGKWSNSWDKSRFEIIEDSIPMPTDSVMNIEVFLSIMPKSADAAVLMFADGSRLVYTHGMEFDCETDERAQEVFKALIALFKETT
jgi:hypothetical protein